MAEIAVSIIAKLAEYLVDPLVRQGKYLFCAGKITKALETEKLRLASRQDGVQKRVQEALNRTEKIDDAVEKWLVEVKDHVGEVQNLEQQMKEDSNCFYGRCPNWKKYRLCRQMARMTVTTKNLIRASEFNPFSVPAPLPDIEYFPSGNFVYFQCTKLASDQLLAALQDDGIHMIGLYGMGGSGKTTLIKEVGKKAKELKLFDRVVFATVSQSPNIRNIQGEIADILGLELREETDSGRARRLSMRLSNGERIFMILDDVWAKINLKDIGIPSEDHYEGCKVLLTTRRQQVCNLMDCGKKIPLHLLSEEESWTLFQKHAHIANNSLINVAKEIARKCKGLPIAIEAVGTSLKGKSIEEWKEALIRLRDAKPVNVEKGVNDAFACLRLSYDYLNTKEAKSLFLICSMYPEDEDIFVEDLFRIAIGLGMYEGVGSLENVRYRVRVCVNNLIDSCLIMPSEKKKNHLRMHDTIRDVALWIASTENRTIVVNLERNMNELAKDKSIKDCYALTSSWDETSQIPQQLDAPKLEILLVKTRSSFELSEEVFRGMEALKVMDIISRDFLSVRLLTSLPQPMNLLTNLRTLRLERFKLGEDWSWLLGLKRLEILDLKHCSFQELPNGLEELTKLKLLDLSWCTIKEQSYEVVERCTQLEELYAFGIKLSRTTLKLGKCSSKNATFPRLQRYELHIGGFEFNRHARRDASMDFSSKALYLGKLNIPASSSFIKDLLQRAEVVCLHKLYEGGKNIVPDIIQVVGYMSELTSLWLHSCSNLECLVEATSHHVDFFQAETLFPKLTKLRLEILANLKQVCCGPPLLGFFEKIQELEIANCPMLTSLFPKSVARSLLLLQKLTIRVCGELKNIMEGDGIGMENEIIPVSNDSSLVFSQLKSLTIYSCKKLEHVFSNSCVQGLVQLEEVSIGSASKLNYVFGHHEDEHRKIQIELPVLKSLKLSGLKNLLSIFPKSYHSSCPSLKELHWAKCPIFTASCANIMENQPYSKALASLSFLNLEKLKVEHCSLECILFSLEGVGFTNTDPQNKLISTLDTLQLKNLSDLEFLWCGPVQTLCLQNLREFRVDGCNNLRTIFSPVILRSIQQLENLYIRYCNELEEIISDVKVEEQHQTPLNAQSPPMCFPKLRRLDVQGCNKLKCLFSMTIGWDDLPELQVLYISEATELEQVFRGEAKPKWQNNSEKKILPNLRMLTLEEVPSLKDFFQGLSLSSENLRMTQVPSLLPAMKNLEIRNCGRLRSENLPALLGSRVEHLRLESLPEQCWKWLSPSQISDLFHLRSLELSECNKLKSIFSKIIHGRSLRMLRSLKLSKCEELEEIITEDQEFQTCLPKLEHLEVVCCNKLKCLFSASSVATLLPHLHSLEILGCKKLEELFGQESEANTDNERKLELPNLRKIRLFRLPSLIDVCKGFKLYAVNLAEIKMSGCPKFSSTVEATGRIDVDLHRKKAKPHANNVNRPLDQLPLFFPTRLDLWESELQKISDLSFICQALTFYQILSFRYLRYLTIYRCGKLKCIFSTSVHGSLQELLCLSISKCEEVEEIIEEVEEAQHLSNPNLCFSLPKLWKLQVNGCDKLKYLFKTATVGMLPKLRYVRVSEAAQLEELFPHKSEGGTIDTQEIVLPDLETIKLEKLPILTDFCKGFKLNAPYLQKVRVEECPKFDLQSLQVLEELGGDSSDSEL